MQRFILCVIVLASVVPCGAGQDAHADTYPETRRLLSKMGLMTVNGPFRTLFESADLRGRDLVAALDDPDDLIRLNA
jgi:hypothetical protein